MSSLWITLIVEGYLLTLLLVPFVILQRRRQSVATVAWIMAIMVLPYLGSVLFLLFGINRVERRAAFKQLARRELDAQLLGRPRNQLLPAEAEHVNGRRLMQLIDRVSGFHATYGNAVEIVADTNRTLGLIEREIASARQSIHLEYYIWREDQTGQRLRDLLIEKARAGVCVRFLFDGIGSLFLGRRFLQPMRDAGIQVANALPGSSLRERWSINLRNHRKIVVVDGTVGFTGGMNIGDEYLGRNPQLGFWRDTHLRLHGPAAEQLQQVFAEDWYFATGEALTQPQLHPQVPQTGGDVAQVVSGGPDGDFDAFQTVFFAAINEAQQRITLATSYFIPTPALATALETAALRGVQVRLLVPGVADHQWMVTAGRAWYEQLLRAGVQIYEYQKGPLHSKTLTIDGNWSLVGSPNFDFRSLLLNFEVAVALYGPRPARELEEQFADDLREAVPIDLARFRTRGKWQVLCEQTLLLFAPVL